MLRSKLSNNFSRDMRKGKAWVLIWKTIQVSTACRFFRGQNNLYEIFKFFWFFAFANMGQKLWPIICTVYLHPLMGEWTERCSVFLCWIGSFVFVLSFLVWLYKGPLPSLLRFHLDNCFAACFWFINRITNIGHEVLQYRHTAQVD